MRSPSLLSKILLSTSVALTLIFAATGWIAQTYVVGMTEATLEEEIQAGFRAYDSLWQARARAMGSLSLLMSAMSDVRAAFGTGDQATIRDTAGELWSRVSDEDAFFLVTDPGGRIIASLGASLGGAGRPAGLIDEVRAAARLFPRQASGFLVRQGRLYQATVTPVYVQSASGPALLNVLVAGFSIDGLVARRFRDATGGSEFVFHSAGQVFASTLNERSARAIAAANSRAAPRRSDGVMEYAALSTPLPDIEGRPLGELLILRSFEASRERISTLRRNLVLGWVAAMLLGLLMSYLLARRIVEPVTELDRAATELGRQNYRHRVRVSGDDELGRLAAAFNGMAERLQKAREELITQERIATIGRLSSSIVHDLRNPLAAVYGGAEMLVDSDLPESQVKRLAGNIYRASRRIQDLLQELLEVSRKPGGSLESCRLREIAAAACEAAAAPAGAQGVRLETDIPETLEVAVQRARLERVFLNLITNALEAMPGGGSVRLRARRAGDWVEAEVEDDGPGIAPEIRDTLFQPFVTSGKRNGLGLGLALSRQTVLEHGGDMWVEAGSAGGARFRFRLPAGRQSDESYKPAASGAIPA